MADVIVLLAVSAIILSGNGKAMLTLCKWYRCVSTMLVCVWHSKQCEYDVIILIIVQQQ